MFLHIYNLFICILKNIKYSTTQMFVTELVWKAKHEKTLILKCSTSFDNFWTAFYNPNR